MASWGGGQPHQGVRHQEDDAGLNRGRQCPRTDGAIRRVGGWWHEAEGQRQGSHYGEGLDLGAITEALGVEPTYTRLGETYDDWEYTIPRAECASVSERIGALRRALGDGAGRLAPALEGRDADVGVELSVHAVIGDEPDLTLTRGDLAFLGALGAEFGIDPYPYYPDETDDLPPVGEGA